VITAAQYVAHALLRRQPACGRTRVVAIDGRSGAGKTDLAADLSAVLGAPVFALEDIYPGWRGLDAATAAVRDVLAAIAVDEIGRAERWDWERQRPGAAMSIPPSPVLVVEGVGAGARSLRPFFSLLVWLEAPDDVRRRRALARDDGVFDAWWETWAAQERAHFARELTASAADIIVHSH